MKRSSSNTQIFLRLLLLAAFLIIARGMATAGPPASAVAAFNSYVGGVEERLGRQHRSPDVFLAAGPGPQSDLHLRRGDLIVEQLTPLGGTELPGALLHHWRATGFAPGATVADFERLMQDFNAYPQHFSPEVLRARVILQQGDWLQASMRVRQHHILTVVMDTTYDVSFSRLDPQRGFSISRSTQISEIDSPGAPTEHVLSSSEEHGFLWRMNTYWSYEERDGGLYMQIESVSLSRSIPRGLGWAVGPFVESIPRDSLEFTLRSACNVLRK